MKILILKPSSLGDVVQALPVLRCLKAHLPHAQVWWWIETTLAPLLEGDPDLAGLVPFDRRNWARPAHWAALWRGIQWMRAQRFDWVIDLQCLARSGSFSWIANGGLLVGLDEPREGARGFYDLAARRQSFDTHAVDWYLSVLPLLKVPVRRDLPWLPPRPRTTAELAAKFPRGNERWVALQPGARWENKRWPAANFARAAQLLAAEIPELRFSVLGGKDDTDLGRGIAATLPGRCLDLTGKLTLPEMVEWIRGCRLMITNDTGPMHVAAALGVPVTGLFGPTEPARTGPYGQRQHVLQAGLTCVPCMKDRCHHSPALECLTLISPEQVARAGAARLAHQRFSE